MPFLPESAPPLERIAAPDLAFFRREHVEASRPVIVTGVVCRWRAFETWSVPHLARRFGAHRVACSPLAEAHVRLDAPKGVALQEVPLEYALARVERREAYVMTPIERALRELLSDVETPRYCRGRVKNRLWISPPDVGTPLHRDFPENLLAQVCGRKQVLLLPPTVHDRVYAFPIGSRVPNFSPVDLEAPDRTRYPDLPLEARRVVTLEPGEMLYLPSRWWHQVRSYDQSISINFWWAEPPYSWLERAGSLLRAVRS